MDESSHRMVWRRARPARAALLLPEIGPAWHSMAKNALISLSLTWGGINDLIIPTGSDNAPHPAFRRALRAHDPDYIAAYQATEHELIRTHPDAFYKWVDNEPDHAIATITELQERYETALASRTGWWNGAPAVATTRSWCSPYPSESGYSPVTRRGAPLDRPLVPLSSFPALLAHPVDLDLDVLGEPFELMVRMRIGGLGLEPPTEKSNPERFVADVGDELALGELALLSYVVHPPRPESNVRHLEELHSVEIPATEGIDPMSPLRRTRHGMMNVSFEPRRTWVVVIGDTVEDFCFALACDRLFTCATWLPKEIIDSQRLVVPLLELRSLFNSLTVSGLRVIVTSVSLDEEAIHAARLVAFTALEDAADGWSEVKQADQLEFGQPMRLADVDSLQLGDSSICYVDKQGSLSVAPALEDSIFRRSPGQPNQLKWHGRLTLTLRGPVPRHEAPWVRQTFWPDVPTTNV